MIYNITKLTMNSDTETDCEFEILSSIKPYVESTKKIVIDIITTEDEDSVNSEDTDADNSENTDVDEDAVVDEDTDADADVDVDEDADVDEDEDEDADDLQTEFNVNISFLKLKQNLEIDIGSMSELVANISKQYIDIIERMRKSYVKKNDLDIHLENATNYRIYHESKLNKKLRQSIKQNHLLHRKRNYDNLLLKNSNKRLKSK